MRKFNYNYFNSPLGKLEIRSDDEGLYAIKFIEDGEPLNEENANPNLHVIKTFGQLDAYFSGALKNFELKLQFRGTDFQNSVWTELTKIPFGKSVSYLHLAKQLGDEKCIRAAASANGKNPFAIVIPCHRVIGTNGSLTGYAGGLWRKQWLLEHEAKLCGTLQTLF